MAPLISVITVTWNAASVLERTLRSVNEQTATSHEHLVIDGASTDGTLALVREHATERTRVQSEPDHGLYDAMNKGLDLARGRYVVFLNAGDTFADSATLARVAALASTDPGVIYGQTVLVDADGRVLGPRHLPAPPTLSADDFKQGMLVCHQAFVARRDLAPHFDLRYRYSADYDWCIRVLRQSPHNAYAGPEPLVHYLAEGLTTRHHRASLRERFAIMCHYWGTLPTLARHLAFVPRYLKRRLQNSPNGQ